MYRFPIALDHIVVTMAVLGFVWTASGTVNAKRKGLNGDCTFFQRCKKGLKCHSVPGSKAKRCGYKRQYWVSVDCHHKKIPKSITQSKDTVVGFFDLVGGSWKPVLPSNYLGLKRDYKFTPFKKSPLTKRDKLPVRCSASKHGYFSASARKTLSRITLTAYGTDPLFIDQLKFKGPEVKGLRARKIGDENGLGWCLSTKPDAMKTHAKYLYRGRCFEFLVIDPLSYRAAGLTREELGDLTSLVGDLGAPFLAATIAANPKLTAKQKANKLRLYKKISSYFR